MLQLKVFLDEVQQHHLLSTIRSFLRLYTTLPIQKLAAYMEMVCYSLSPLVLCGCITLQIGVSRR